MYRLLNEKLVGCWVIFEPQIERCHRKSFHGLHLIHCRNPWRRHVQSRYRFYCQTTFVEVMANYFHLSQEQSQESSQEPSNNPCRQQILHRHLHWEHNRKRIKCSQCSQQDSKWRAHLWPFSICLFIKIPGTNVKYASINCGSQWQISPNDGLQIPTFSQPQEPSREPSQVSCQMARSDPSQWPFARAIRNSRMCSVTVAYLERITSGASVRHLNSKYTYIKTYHLYPEKIGWLSSKCSTIYKIRRHHHFFMSV